MSAVIIKVVSFVLSGKLEVVSNFRMKGRILIICQAALFYNPKFRSIFFDCCEAEDVYFMFLVFKIFFV